MEKKGLKITCLNFEGFKNKRPKQKKTLKDDIRDFIKNEKVDIIAGQEFPKELEDWIKEDEVSVDGKAEEGFYFFAGFIIKNKNYKKESNSNEKIKEIWNKLCPYIDFKSSYWAIKEIKFNGERIKLINIHIGPTYKDIIKISLLKYLNTIEDDYIILMGDFNVAKNNQTESPIKGNHKFIEEIISKGYTELQSKKEKEKGPHYTYYHKKGKTTIKYEGKKLDHIFVSDAFKNTFKTSIEYDDKVNYRFKEFKGKEIGNAFTDHSAIRLTIEKKGK